MRKFFTMLKNAIRETDKLLLFFCIAASAYGILAVTSATYSSITDGNLLSREASVMILAVTLGLTIAVLVSFIDSDLIIRLWPLIAIVCIALMAVTYRWGHGPELRPDARVWLSVGNTGLDFQSSELVKIGFIITFGMHIDLVHDKINSLKNIIFLCIHALIPTALVIVTGDLGSALIFIIIFISMMFLGGLSLKNLLIGIAGGLAATPFAWLFLLGDLQKNRFRALAHPELYADIIYQQEKGLIAIGSGKWFGQGFLNGEYTQAGIVPENQNDMIFTVIGEELGFIGCFAAIAILALIILKITKTGRQCKDKATAMMCYGVSAMIAGHVIINIGMCLMLLPVVGITLPFFSAGGSSNLCLYVGIGLVLSIHRYNQSREAVNFKLRRVRTPFSEE